MIINSRNVYRYFIMKMRNIEKKPSDPRKISYQTRSPCKDQSTPIQKISQYRDGQKNSSFSAISKAEVKYSPMKLFDKQANPHENASILMNNRFSNKAVLLTEEKLKFSSITEYKLLKNQHQIEVQKLLLEMAQLNEKLYQTQRNKDLQLQKLRDQLQHQNLKQILALKNAQTIQKESYQAEIKQLQQLITQKQEKNAKIKVILQREQKAWEQEKMRLQIQLKSAIEAKNENSLRQKSGKDKAIMLKELETQKQIDKIQEECGRQLKQLQTKLLKQQYKCEKLTKDQTIKDAELLNLQQLIETQKKKIIAQMKLKLQLQKQSHLKFRQLVADIMQQKEQNNQNKSKIEAEIHEKQINQLINLLQLKEYESTKQQGIWQALLASCKIQNQCLISQLQHYKRWIADKNSQTLQETELLKVKTAEMHTNQINNLVSVYETKILTLTQQINDAECRINENQHFLLQETRAKYQMKKKYQNAISGLNAKVIRLRTGLSSLETEMKEKIDNQKSLMLITSKSIIKDIQLKGGNTKFMEEELRKLRQLMDLQGREIQNQNIKVQKKIKQAEQELERLSKRCVDIKREAIQTEKDLRQIISNKENQINHLKREMQNMIMLEKTQGKEASIIDEISKEQAKKDQQNTILKDKISFLEQQLGLLRSELEHYQMEANINHQEARKTYEELAKTNLAQIKAFYENRISQLEKDKDQLKKLNSNQSEKITELVEKYKEIEMALQAITLQSKRRTEMEQKVMLLGNDLNLVKNLEELFRSFQSRH